MQQPDEPSGAVEAVLEPELPIVDPHHHLWDVGPLPDALDAHPLHRVLQRTPRYLFDELHADCRGSGHNVVASVYVQCGTFYRVDGPEALQPVGEVEVANGVAAQSASGLYGPFRGCAGIVGFADLRMGEPLGDLLDAEIGAGGGRLRGIRHNGAYDADASILGPSAHAPEGLYMDPAFREGFRQLGARGLVFDAFVLEPQIAEVTNLARAFPEQPIVLDHLGTPVGIGAYAGRTAERFPEWQAAVRELATCPNVSIKLGGLTMGLSGLPGVGPDIQATSRHLAAIYRPYVEVAIEAFGVRRAMFESNFPVDRWGSDYRTLWNAFKHVAAGSSAEEKYWLFGGSACSFYGLALDSVLPGQGSLAAG